MQPEIFVPSHFIPFSPLLILIQSHWLSCFIVSPNETVFLQNKTWVASTPLYSHCSDICFSLRPTLTSYLKSRLPWELPALLFCFIFVQSMYHFLKYCKICVFIISLVYHLSPLLEFKLSEAKGFYMFVLSLASFVHVVFWAPRTLLTHSRWSRNIYWPNE